ncbi:MAG: hypothetical protein KME27_10920 [Lyngbya sp. HA4199-MV5]|nr:hypothetical protein [Lyngbya sp. HA4199-MV5]
MIAALTPFPGSKTDFKYDGVLYPSLTAKAICEPFMGAACRSMINHHLPTTLGEINAAQRAIALALHNPQAYSDSYKEAAERFWGGTNGYRILAYAGRKKAQTLLGEREPELCATLTVNWRSLTADLYRWMYSESDWKLAGYYAFCIRACFGNVMRLNPQGTHFNVAWHIDKLKNACEYSPERWLKALQAINWNPTVLPCWEAAIAAVVEPASTWLLLDPPYWVPGDQEKMTPCYPGHSIGTNGAHEETFRLAVDSLQAGLERGFSQITVCNYHSDKLDAALTALMQDAGYSYKAVLMGECKALGNSNGRYKHGQRVDKRDRPVEMIYQVERQQRSYWQGLSTSQRSEQLSLLEVA